MCAEGHTGGINYAGGATAASLAQTLQGTFLNTRASQGSGKSRERTLPKQDLATVTQPFLRLVDVRPSRCE
jgi:hypothetical protein